jgi:hypothetical protein
MVSSTDHNVRWIRLPVTLDPFVAYWITAKLDAPLLLAVTTASGAQGRAEIILSIQVLIVSHFVKSSH